MQTDFLSASRDYCARLHTMITKRPTEVPAKQNDAIMIKQGITLTVSGAFSLLQLDLSANFLQEFPSDALRHLTDLKFLNISNNLITVSILTDSYYHRQRTFNHAEFCISLGNHISALYCSRGMFKRTTFFSLSRRK